MSSPTSLLIQRVGPALWYLPFFLLPIGRTLVSAQFS
jgi:hypothetical protein